MMRFKDVKDETLTVLNLIAQRTWNIMLQLLWYFLHLVVSVWHVLLTTNLMLQSYLISTLLSKNYKALDLTRLQCLAIVVENDDAHDTIRVVKLLGWLSQIGVNRVCLYDEDGVLKKSKKIILQEFGDARSWKESDQYSLFHDRKQMTFEFASFSGGKEGITKAANFLCSESLKGSRLGPLGRYQDEQVFTESDMAGALRLVGCEGFEPDLLLSYGAVRCHNGFPAWRMRYTEIVHMGSLRSMKYGALVKVIKEFTKIHQNYVNNLVNWFQLAAMELLLLSAKLLQFSTIIYERYFPTKAGSFPWIQLSSANIHSYEGLESLDENILRIYNHGIV